MNPAFNPADFYERVAKYYPEETINSFSDYWKALDFVVHSHLDGITGTLIDVGCGTGRLLRLWKKYNLDAIGLEYSNIHFPLLVENAKRYAIQVIHMDVRKEHVVNKADLVFNTQVMLHILPKDIDAFFANLVRMSKKYIAFVVWYDTTKLTNDKSLTGYPIIGNSAANSFTHDYPRLIRENDLTILRTGLIHFSRNNVYNNYWLLEKMR